MAKNVFIGVGGSGTKCAESLVHLCAAGIGPDRLTLLLVDQDAENGNLNRTIDAVRGYRQARAELHPDGLVRRWSPLRTIIDFDEDAPVLTPYPDTSATLEDMLWRTAEFGPNERRGLQHLLTGEELRTPLGKGFRAKPAVGSVAFLAALAAQQTTLFKQKLDGATRAGSEGASVRVFLAGSLFGGTGAAGVPSLGTEICRSRTGTHGVQVAAGLMMPYFTSAAPPPDADGARFADPRTFPRAARQALRYYSQTMESAGDRPFDHIYLMGSPNLPRMPIASGGREEQLNPSLLPELLCATAALNWFGDAEHRSSPVSLAFYADQASRQMVATDVPSVPGAPASVTTISALATLARTHLAFQWIFAPIVSSSSAARPYEKQPWFRNLVGPSASVLDEGARAPVFGNLLLFGKRFIEWIGAVQVWSATGSLDTKLFNLADIVRKVEDRSHRNFVADTSREVPPTMYETILQRLDPTKRIAPEHERFADLCAFNPSEFGFQSKLWLFEALHYVSRPRSGRGDDVGEAVE